MIGVFDSGYGGLSVFSELSKRFPDLDFTYLGDNGRAPYGSRSPEIITAYTKEALEWFFKQGAELVILACNTASSQALPKLAQTYGEKVIGVVEPVLDAINAQSDLKSVGIIATKATVRSGIYSKNLAKKGRKVIEQACPLLVPLVEEGITSGPLAETIIRSYLEPLLREGIETLVLGCTHYPFLKETIKKIAPDVAIIDASSVMPKYLQSFLNRHEGLSKKLSRSGKREFFTTDVEDDFARFVEKRLKLSIKPKRISL